MCLCTFFSFLKLNSEGSDIDWSQDWFLGEHKLGFRNSWWSLQNHHVGKRLPASGQVQSKQGKVHLPLYLLSNTYHSRSYMSSHLSHLNEYCAVEEGSSCLFIANGAPFKNDRCQRASCVRNDYIDIAGNGICTRALSICGWFSMLCRRDTLLGTKATGCSRRASADVASPTIAV